MTIKTLNGLLKHCQSKGWTMKCFYDDAAKPDYLGNKAKKARKALEACDEMYLHVYDDDKLMGWVLIVNDPDMHPDEQINDYAGERILEIFDFTGE